MGDIPKKLGDTSEISGAKPERVIRTDQEMPIDAGPSERVAVTRRDKKEVPTFSRESIWDIILKYLFFAGSIVVRRFNRTKRRVKFSLQKAYGGFLGLIYRTRNFLHRAYRGFVRRVAFPFTQIKEAAASEKTAIEKVREQGSIPWRSYGRIIRKTAGSIVRVLQTIFNYIAPLAAAIVLIVVVEQTLAVPTALHVTYKGMDLGYIKNESSFNEALKDVDGRIAEGVDTNYTAGAPLYQMEYMTPERIAEIAGDENAELEDIFTSTKDLASGIIEASGDEIIEAYGLYADGELVGVVKSRDQVLDEFDKIEKENTTGKPDERWEFDKAISYTHGIFPMDSVIPEEELIAKLYEKQDKDIMYTVVAGDTPSGIADKMGIPVDTLWELNPGLANKFIEGEELYISKARPFLSIKNIYTEVYPEEVAFRTVKNEDSLYAPSFRRVDRAGVPGIDMVTAEITMIDGVVVDELILSKESVREPLEEIVTVGTTGSPRETGEFYFSWPAQGGFIGTGLGGYPGHSGVDINKSGGIGAPVYAAAPGVVTKVVHGYTGYGNYLEIDHQNGYKTLYAHNTELYVSVGDYVGRKQIVATIGNTGNSSGPHLHFEVSQGGRIVNPADYITPGR